jgi:hypothetical protein
VIGRDDHGSKSFLNKVLVELRAADTISRSQAAIGSCSAASARRSFIPQPASPEIVMSSTSAKIALALLLLAAPAASFARMAGEAGTGNVAISGIPSGPANVGGVNNINIDPSGIGNASKLPSLPQPHISVPQVPQFR